MNADDFRLILIAAALRIFPVAIYHRVKAHRAGDRLDRSKEGRFILFTLRPIGVDHTLVTGGPYRLIRHRRSRIGEAELVARFGGAYEAYMRRTPRFLPKL